MVAVTRRGVVKNVRRISRPAASSSGAATIALPSSLKLENYPRVGKKKVYLIDDDMWLHLLSSGWRVSDVEYVAARRLVDSDQGVDIYEVKFFFRDAVLERRRRFGTREYTDVIRVRIPWSSVLKDCGWEWLQSVEEES